jgi:hypothetical protein
MPTTRIGVKLFPKSITKYAMEPPVSRQTSIYLIQ